MNTSIPYKVLIWGMGRDYEGLINQFNYETLKGNMEILGIVVRKEDRYCNFKDGYKTIIPNDISDIPFDYLLIASGGYFSEIKKEAIRIGVDSKRIINAKKVFHIPRFDFGRYIELLKNPVSIVCDDCWGGYVYNRLDLQFASPFINILWDGIEYAKLIRNLEKYLSTDLKMVEQGNIEKGIAPIGKLGDDSDAVQMNFIHCYDFESAKEQWDRRIKRFNFNNIIVKMGFSSNIPYERKKVYFDSFETVPYKKTLFYLGDDCCIPEQFQTNRFAWSQIEAPRVEFFNYNDYVRRNYFWDMDILKLLIDGKDYSLYR